MVESYNGILPSWTLTFSTLKDSISVSHKLHPTEDIFDPKWLKQILTRLQEFVKQVGNTSF